MRQMLRFALIGLAMAALGAGLSKATGMPLFSFVGLFVCFIFSARSIKYATESDPEGGRVSLTDVEAKAAEDRLPWVQAVVDELCKAAFVHPLRAVMFSNHGAWYSPFKNRIGVSRAFCARLSDEDLRLILAHEVAHASRRNKAWLTFSEAARIREEIAVDAMSLQITGATNVAWSNAMTAAMSAEGSGSKEHELMARQAALGVPHNCSPRGLAH